VVLIGKTIEERKRERRRATISQEPVHLLDPIEKKEPILQCEPEESQASRVVTEQAPAVVEDAPIEETGVQECVVSEDANKEQEIKEDENS
jgi:hypothetical protein